MIDITQFLTRAGTYFVDTPETPHPLPHLFPVLPTAFVGLPPVGIAFVPRCIKV